MVRMESKDNWEESLKNRVCLRENLWSFKYTSQPMPMKKNQKKGRKKEYSEENEKNTQPELLKSHKIAMLQ